MALAAPCGGCRPRRGALPRPRLPGPASGHPARLHHRAPREAVIAICIFPPPCGFPDEPCSECESAPDPGPPCCHTPHLCGGPHDDCYDALRAETIDTIVSAFDSCDEPADECCCAATHTDDAVPLTQLRLPVNRDRWGTGDRARNSVVHISERRRCCVKDGCGPSCR